MLFPTRPKQTPPRYFCRGAASGVMLVATYLGSTALGTPPAEEVSSSPTFLESVHCALCHANSSRAGALRDQQKRGVAPYDLWHGTAMANSARDPFWRAVLSAEVAATGSKKGLIEEKCTRCHAPMAAPAPESPPGKVLTYLAGEDQRAWLGLDGVSCTLCHQIRDQDLGAEASFTGHFVLGQQGPIYGPHLDPFIPPMQHHTGYTPTHSKHVLRAGLCATCHTLNTEAVRPDGSDAGHRLHEQSPYLEWRNSIYNDERPEAGSERRSCQNCHMPTDDEDGSVIKTQIAHNPGGRDFPFLAARSPFGRHTFYGGNVFLIRMLRQHRERLGVQASDESLAARLDATRALLSEQTARVSVGQVQRTEQQLRIPVTVTNLAGHKLPTAYPSRRVWLRVEVRDRSGRLIFASGQFDKQGRLIDLQRQPLASEWAGGPVLPHFQHINSDDQVQVYQSIMAEPDGGPTFTLLRGARYMKDNRILPRGWRPDHTDARATAPVGTDEDTNFSAGADTVVYVVPVSGEGPHAVHVWLHYQVVSPRYASELFTFSTAEIATFRQFYHTAHRQPETLATARRDLP